MLCQVREGDRITLDAAGRRLQLHVPEPELAARRAAWVAPPRPELASRGYYKLYYDHVLQSGREARVSWRMACHGSTR